MVKWTVKPFSLLGFTLFRLFPFTGLTHRYFQSKDINSDYEGGLA
jgi:hypothetical protein